MGSAALVLVALSACSTDVIRPDAKSTQAQAPPGPRLTDLLRATTSFDFDPADTPEDLLERVDVAVVGSVQSVEPVLLHNEGEATGGVVLTVKVEDSWKEHGGELASVDVILRWPKNLDLRAFDEDLPTGSRLAFFGYRVDLPVIDRDPGLPDLYDPDPQGLMLETAEGALTNVWGESGPEDEEWRRITSLVELSEALEVPK